MVSAGQAYWMQRRRKRTPSHQVLTAELASITGAVNVRGKLKDKMVMNLTTLVAYTALGPAAGDAWRPVGVFTSAQDVTPA